MDRSSHPLEEAPLTAITNDLEYNSSNFAKLLGPHLSIVLGKIAQAHSSWL
jgi:hypothetical protein